MTGSETIARRALEEFLAHFPQNFGYNVRPFIKREVFGDEMSGSFNYRLVWEFTPVSQTALQQDDTTPQEQST